MAQRVTRDEAMKWLCLYGEALPRDQWEEGERVLGAYISDLQDEIARLKGAHPLPFDVSPI